MKVLTRCAFGFAGLSLLFVPTRGADIARGKLIFAQNCALCHSAGAALPSQTGGGQGPTLVGVVGRRAGSVPGFGYTQALIDSKLTWDEGTLDRFLTNPTATVPGTSMVTPVNNAEDRADVIAFLASLKPEKQSPVAQNESPAIAASAGLKNPTAEGDWQSAHPGVRYHIKVQDLPPPFSTGSAGNGPRIVRIPANARLSAPPGFTVQRFVGKLSNPRLLRVAPNGDIFLAETGANRVRVIRAADGAETPSANEIFADGLDRPFGIAFFPLGSDPQWV